jgi:hypothetical protein
MKRNFKKNEKLALYIAGSLLVLIILWIILIYPAANSIKELSKSLESKKESLKKALEFKNQYNALGQNVKKFSDIISRRDPNFSLKQTISDIENKINFRSTQAKAENIKKLGKDYIETSIDYTYTGKTLDEIIKFLYEIEDPSKVISISRFELQPSSDGTKFDTLRILLSVVTKVEK